MTSQKSRNFNIGFFLDFEHPRFKDAPYVGYGHKLQKGERFMAAMTERQADSLLRADLMKRLMMFKDYGKDALLLAVLSYNVGTGRLLGYGKHPKSRLLRKIESGDRNFGSVRKLGCNFIKWI